MKDRKSIYVLFILLQSLVYGIGNPVTKIAFNSITPLWLLAVRFTAASMVLILFFGKRILVQAKEVSSKIWLPSCLCCAGAYISCNVALSLTSATNVGFIMSLPVLFTPLLHSIVTKRKYDLRRLPLQLVTIVGLLLLCCNGGFLSVGAGELLALLDALCIAGHLVFSEQATTKMDVLALASLQILVTAVLSVAGALLFDDMSVLNGIQKEAWLVAMYLALICTIAAYLMQNAAVSHLSSGTVSMLQCSQPVMTALIAFVMLNEKLSGIGLAGAAIITLCLLLDGRLSSRLE